VFHALVGDMPVEERLELVAAVGADGAIFNARTRVASSIAVY
jgi:hypothetical protein